MIKVDEEMAESKIEGFCDVFGDGRMSSVISINTIHGTWHLGSSMCLPSNIDRAKCVLGVYNEVFAKLDEILGTK